MQAPPVGGVPRTYVIVSKERYDVGEFLAKSRGYEVAESEARGSGFAPDDPRAQLSVSLEAAPYFGSSPRTAVEEAAEKGYKVGE